MTISTIQNININFDTDNAAFDDGQCEYEVARILTALSERIKSDGMVSGQVFILRDINGNKVGTATTI